MTDSDPELMTIFAEALDRTDPADRAAYLDGACRGDSALRQRVEALLAAHDGAGRFLEGVLGTTPEATASEALLTPRTAIPGTRPASGLVTAEHGSDGSPTTVQAPPPPDRAGGSVAGQVISGRYTLLEVLGEGGMGTVYRASQIEPVKRQVALKLIKTGMDSRSVLARFDAERQALALMDHPNIARVYDGGTTAAGQPFFVMELVDGVPITVYCDRKRLPVRARLELFVAVCQSVQHAHQKGIIHRDLKPGNVLVTEVDGRPMPKVIDFGVAKAMEQRLTDLSLADTGAIVGTPTYMSPEQADPSSMDIDTRTDIYALGVILYELLAGSPPIDAKQFKRGAILEMLRMVREVDPPRPSTKVSTSDALPNIAASRAAEPAQLKRALRGDLDWIVMKALEKDRSRRYETANGFAADVLRHLASEPVQAAPPSRAYRLRKFVRKHRGAVVAAGLVVLALVAGIAGTTWGLIRAEWARAAEAKRVEERDDALKKEAERVGERDAAVKVANTRAEELKYRLGISEFLLARAAYDDRDVILAADRLENVPPEQRGWEWRYLRRLTRGGLFTLYGHSDCVTSASFSPDGTRIATGSDDKTVRVWDARTGSSLLDLKGHTGPPLSVSFSPDSKRIVTGSGYRYDRTKPGEAKVWDARTGRVLLDLKGHSSAVISVSFSPDGTRIVTGSLDRTAKVWDARTGLSLLDLKGQKNAVTGVAFSPDGSRIASSTEHGAKVWEARTGSPLFDLKHMAAVNGVSFSPDGTRIVTATGEGTARVSDASNGRALLILKGHRFVVFSASFSPDGTRIVTASNDRTARVWDARTGETLLELKGHAQDLTHVSQPSLGGVMAASFSPDGTRIVTAGSDGTAKVWDTATETIALEVKGHWIRVASAASSPDAARIVTRSWDAWNETQPLERKGRMHKMLDVSFSPDGSRIITGGGWFEMPSNGSLEAAGEAKVWDAWTGSPLLDLKGHRFAVTSVSFSPDGTRIVAGGGRITHAAYGGWKMGEARVWDARSGKALFDLKGHTALVYSVSFSPDGTRIVTASQDGVAKVWDAHMGSRLLDLKGHTGEVLSASYSPNGMRIVTGGGGMTTPGEARVWDARTGNSVLDLKGHTALVYSVSFSPDGTRIVTAGQDGAAKVWDARTGRLLLDLIGHAGWLSGVAFSPDGSRIVTGSRDRTATVWDTRTGTPLLGLKGHSGMMRSVSFSPNGTRIAACEFPPDAPGGAREWYAGTGTTLLDLKGHSRPVTSLSFSPDGTRIVTGSGDRTGKVWDWRSGKLLLDLIGHEAEVWSTAFSPDGTRIVTGSGDHTAKLWDAGTGTSLLDLKGHTGPVDSVSFSPDGTRIITGSVDDMTKVWDAGTGEELKGEPIPPGRQPGWISPDGRWFAHPAGNRVELISLQPDAEELAYRRRHTQPDFARYREAYEAAIRAKDGFAARFYLNLLPPSDRALTRAEEIVASLFGRLVIRDDVLAALRTQPVGDPEIQAACLKLARTWPNSAEDYRSVAEELITDPGRPEATYRRALGLAEAACQLEPENGGLLGTLGRAQYRAGLISEALATLKRSTDFNNNEEPYDLAFLALAQHRLRQSEDAHETLRRLREVMKDARWANVAVLQGFLREAVAIELDRVFPADPFAP